jgi:hypothetical protein
MVEQFQLRWLVTLLMAVVGLWWVFVRPRESVNAPEDPEAAAELAAERLQNQRKAGLFLIGFAILQFVFDLVGRTNT